MQASTEDHQPTIVAVGFSRAKALSRLLESIGNSDLPSGTRLLISLDGGASKDAIQVAREFEYEHGEKEVELHPENLGLRKHILWVGDQTEKYGSVIVLEDDVLVDRFFYRYAVSAIQKYDSDVNIAGIALYSPGTNEYVNLPFEPLVNNSASYFMQVPCSCGQAWTQSQWRQFRSWYDKNSEANDLENVEIPQIVRAWPESSWKKYFAAYLADQGRYFSYPYRSYTTNCSDAGGTHIKESDSYYQVPLADQSRDMDAIEYCDFSEDGVLYDAYMEPSPRRLSAALELSDGDLIVDTYGSKPLNLLRSSKYCLTTKKCAEPIREFELALRPIEQNLLIVRSSSVPPSDGTGSTPILYLVESQALVDNDKQFMRLSQYFSYQRLDATDFGFKYLPMFLRKLAGRIMHRR